MPTITVDEKALGYKQSGSVEERLFIVSGTTDQRAARDAMLADLTKCPLTVPITASDGGTIAYYRQDIDAGVEPITDTIWVGTVNWKPLSSGDLQPQAFQVSFDISGVQQKIQVSRNTKGKYTASGKIQRDFGGLIGVNQDGTVEGCDVVFPVVTEQIQKILRAGDVNEAFIRTMSQIVGSVNNSQYRNHDPGELLLTRVAGQQRADGNWDMNFGFAVSYNETDLKVGSITGIVKAGWDYLWTYYEEKDYVVGGAKVCNKYPANVFVEEVYRRSNFDQLLI